MGNNICHLYKTEEEINEHIQKELVEEEDLGNEDDFPMYRGKLFRNKDNHHGRIFVGDYVFNGT
jgi:hypothetical protein